MINHKDSCALALLSTVLFWSALSAQSVSSPLAVGGDVSAPVFLPQPKAATVLQAPTQRGVTTIALVIDQEGFVSRTRVLQSSGNKLVDAKALNAARSYRFRPSRRGDVPVAVAVTMDVPATVGTGEVFSEPEKPKAEAGVIPPKLLRHIDPEFPAKKSGCPMETTVEVGLIVDVHGLPKRLTIRHPSKLDGYDTEALRAVEKYRFSPASKGGVDIEFPMDVDIGFSCFP